MAKKITKKPSGKVSSLGAPTRKGNTFSRTWKVPSSLTDSNSDHRIENLQVRWDAPKGKQRSLKTKNTKTTSSSYNASTLMKSYYPNTKTKLANLRIAVRGKNSKGTGPWAKGLFKFAAPAKPTVTKSVNDATGVVTFNFKSTNDGKYHRQDTYYEIKSKKSTDSAWTVHKQKSNNSLNFSDSVNISGANGLLYDEHIKVICTVYNRGCAGNSASQGPSEHSSYPGKGYQQNTFCHIFAWPAKPTIGKITVKGQIIKVAVSTNHQPYFHFTDTVELQRGIGPNKNELSWSNVEDGKDDGTCTGLSDNKNDVKTDPGDRVFYRIHAQHGTYHIYSDIKEATDLFNSEATATGVAVDQILAYSSSAIDNALSIQFGFTKSFVNGKPSSNKTTIEYAETKQDEAYRDVSWTSYELLDQNSADMGGIATDTTVNNSAYTLTHVVPDLEGRRYIVRIRRELVNTDYLDISNESVGKWYYYVNDGSSNQLLKNATPIPIYSSSRSIKDTINDINLTFETVSPWRSTQLLLRLGWTRFEVKVDDVMVPVGNCTQVELRKEGTDVWSSFVDVNDEDVNIETDEYRNVYSYNATGLDAGATYFIRARRVLKSTDYLTVVSETVYSPWIQYSDPVTISNNASAEGGFGNDLCTLESAVANNEIDTISVKFSWPDDTESTNGLEILWDTKIPPKTLTTRQLSSYQVMDTNLDDGVREFEIEIDGLTKGSHNYIDARRFYKGEDGTITYSNNFASGPRRDTARFAADVVVSATDDPAGIISAESTGNGTKIALIMGYFEDNSDGLEISYSDDPDAWESSSPPTLVTVDDETYKPETSTDENYTYQRSFFISGLTANKTYYIKVRRYMDGSPTTYGPYSPVMVLTTLDPVNNDVVVIDSIESDEDGQGLRLKLGWDDDNSVKTVISYSDYAEAWQSSNKPSTLEVVDNDWVLEDSESFKNYATAIIRGLDESKKYYIKARRVDEDDAGGPYTVMLEAIPSSTPTSLVLNVPTPITYGDDFEISWAFQSDGIQNQYILSCSATYNSETVSFELSSNEDARGAVGIGWAEFADKFVNLLGIEVNELVNLTDLKFGLKMTTGGNWAEASVDTSIATPPQLSLTDEIDQTEGARILTVQPLNFNMASDRTDVRVLARVVSNGVTLVLPDRDVSQPEGDVIWTDVISGVEWSDGAAEYVLPEGIPFIDQGVYTLHVTLVDNLTNLRSTEASVPILVNWAHQAAPPSDISEIEPRPEERSVVIRPLAPVEGYAAGDVCDIYRHTLDGNQLVASGIEYGTEVHDFYAPYFYNIPLNEDDPEAGYNELHYTLLNRTPDGDVDYIDVDYYMLGNGLTFDWDNHTKRLEMPWNAKVSDSYEKSFEERTHLDGTTQGYWNRGRSHSASLSTEIYKIDSADERGNEKLRLCRELASYAGPVFVRTPYGGAYCANVDVSINEDYDATVASVSFEAKEIAIADEYRAYIPDVDTEDEEEQP